MRSHIADPTFPFPRGVRETHTVFSGGDLNDSLAAITLSNNRMTAASVKLAPSFAHHDALTPLPYRCTNHGYHILSLKILENKNHSILFCKNTDNLWFSSGLIKYESSLMPQDILIVNKKIENILAR